MSNPEAINYGRASNEQKKQDTPPPTTPPHATPTSAAGTPTSKEPMEVISELVAPRHSTPIEDSAQETSRLPSQPQTPVQGAASDRERISSTTSYEGETPRTRKKGSVSEEATTREAMPTPGAPHNAVPVTKRISQLQLRLMGGEGGEESIPPPSPAADDQEMVMSVEVNVTSEEGTKSVKVVDIQNRPADFGLDSLVEWEGQKAESSSEDEGEGSSSPPPKDPSAESKVEFSRTHSQAFSTSRSPSTQFGTPGESSLTTSMLSTLHLRKKGQRHLYRSVKMLNLFSEVERKEKKEAQARLFEAQTIQRQMGLLEQQYEDLEETGKQLEMALREGNTGETWPSVGSGVRCTVALKRVVRCTVHWWEGSATYNGSPGGGVQVKGVTSDPVGKDSQLMQQWLDLVHERNILIRQTNDFSQRMKDLEIEDQLYEIERELRELDQIPGASLPEGGCGCLWEEYGCLGEECRWLRRVWLPGEGCGCLGERGVVALGRSFAGWGGVWLLGGGVSLAEEGVVGWGGVWLPGGGV